MPLAHGLLRLLEEASSLAQCYFIERSCILSFISLVVLLNQQQAFTLMIRMALRTIQRSVAKRCRLTEKDACS